MIQQVIGFDSWKNMHLLAINGFNIPLVERQFSVLLSNIAKGEILPKEPIDDSSTKHLKHVLNSMFSEIYLPENTLSAACFLDDLTQIKNIESHHYAIIIDRNNLKQFDVGIIIQTCMDTFQNLTIIVVNSDSSYIQSVIPKSLISNRFYLGEIFSIQGNTYSNVIKYQSGDTRVYNKAFKLDSSTSSHSLAESLPVFIHQAAAPEHFIITHGYHAFSCSSEIESSISNIQNAVIIFTCQSFQEIERVTREVYTFKQKFGESLRILVKEGTPCIRYNDFHMLINAGAQNIIEHYRSDSVIFDQVRLASLTTMDRSNVALTTLESFFQSPLNHIGFQEFNVFMDVTNNVVDKIKHSQLEFALVELIPFSSVSIAEAKSYCTLRRKGDIATTLDGRIVLFFSSLRLYEVSQALSNVFSISTTEIFSQINTLTTHNDILDKLKELSQLSHSTIQAPSPNGLVKKTVLSSNKAVKVDWESI
ncbi:BcsE family c-di-GMP-binding protein [Vibrio methylphosphonaticus]|uniref:BcsE family c-di-GMP-binding protein n=1 Tax=Vibrio methylphosphonaticus TaxID=2946866 RepID=UPI00202A3AEB|nr:BcsE family c-di-GMP-binding protein [Vibrio methylphosphonaticus]MCL9773973.1 cellulose biosynthesis protein BcsE [Vibrio methylphosphonaticus]